MTTLGNFLLVLWTLCVIVGWFTVASLVALGLFTAGQWIAAYWPGPHGLDRWQ